jgi:tRNA-splicing ligase RtcB (3'-phosphate/5'-hydroxy nucleic acid ligase)
MSRKKPYYRVFGPEFIEPGAREQMDAAMSLPVAEGGALMPDAHLGYGLPIGGVLATRNEVIPYGVGVDIGCRMCLSVMDAPVGDLVAKRLQLKEILTGHTRFGFQGFEKPEDHEVLVRREFGEIEVLKRLHEKARNQIGSSGGGNHFVEFGVVEVRDGASGFDLPPGEYFALLSHSGSRGLGAAVAEYYTRLAMELCVLPRELKQLAWLSLDSPEGQEYWAAMQVCGAYASANHHLIHRRIVGALGANTLLQVENHHNFAWMEEDNHGRPWLVHRKGATPAGKGMLGVIPGSMTLPGYIIQGKGNPESLCSASHGAGRRMSRRRAKKELHREELIRVLEQAGVELIGGGLDEAPQVYKDIREVMQAQHSLVRILGTFMPRVVRMCGDRRFEEVD